MSENHHSHKILHPQRGWRLDLTHSKTAPSTEPNWERAFSDMRALESGERVNGSEQQQVGHFWLRAPEHAPTMGQASDIGSTLSGLAEWVLDVGSDQVLLENAHPITDVLHIGMGGSSLGAQFLVSALGHVQGKALHFIDNLDAHTVARWVDTHRDNLAGTMILIVSKSGKTVETLQLAETVFRLFRSCGHPPEARAVAITHPNSPLAQKAQQEQWLASFPFWSWLGGRFSTLGPPGLLSAGLAGADIPSVLAGARAMDEWTRQEDPKLNPAALIAGAWYELGQALGLRNFVVIPYSDRLTHLGRALQQLLMESLGKRTNRQGLTVAQGLTVYGNKGTSDQHALMQQLLNGRDDAIVLLIQVLDDQSGLQPTEVSLTDTVQHFLLGSRRALIERERPVMVWTIPTIDEASVGATIALFERAVSLYASLIDINAFDQPGVEHGKSAAKELAILQDSIVKALRGRSLPLHELCETLQADPTEVEHLLHRLVLTDRVSCVGDGASKVYRWTP